jgi:hypothetical protein
VSSLQEPLQLWLVPLPAGQALPVTTSSQGSFSISDLPVTEYLLVPDSPSLTRLGLTLPAQTIDLTQEIFAQVELTPRLLEGTSLFGSVTTESDSWLPFAWLSSDEQVTRSDLLSGEYTLLGLTEENLAVTVAAPGYYSQVRLAQEAGVNFNLVPRPDMDILPWGEGSLYLPPETDALVGGFDINFEQGWLWGEGAGLQPLQIQVGKVNIEIPSGRFALERLPAQDAWLYLLDGSALVRAPGQSAVQLQPGQVLWMGGGDAIQISDYQPIVFQALHPVVDVPVFLVWQPALAEQVSRLLVRAGIGTAQTVTLVTYTFMVLLAVALPFLGLYWWRRRRVD